MARLTLLAHKILPNGCYCLKLRVASLVKHVRTSRDSIREVVGLPSIVTWYWLDNMRACNEEDQRALTELHALLVQQRRERDVRAGRDILGGTKL